MQGIAMIPTSPSLHSKTKARIIPMMMEEKFMSTVDTKEVSKLLTCLESTPKRVAAAPPLFFFC